MIIKLFAIRHKPSGGFLPEVRKGYTYSEPSTRDCDIPRLFTTVGGASRALTWWLKGMTSVTYTKEYGFDGFYDTDESWHTVEKPARKLEDMEVIPVLLKT